MSPPESLGFAGLDALGRPVGVEPVPSVVSGSQAVAANAAATAAAPTA
ncbi:hypothetical protein ACFU3O_20335 [Streptomyces antibioticus]